LVPRERLELSRGQDPRDVSGSGHVLEIVPNRRNGEAKETGSKSACYFINFLKM
jgi:hypothetical protein